MNQNQRPLKFFREKCQIFDGIFAKNACDQKLLLVTFYVKSYLGVVLMKINGIDRPDNISILNISVAGITKVIIRLGSVK